MPPAMIREAVTRPTMRFVAIKAAEQDIREGQISPSPTPYRGYHSIRHTKQMEVD